MKYILICLLLLSSSCFAADKWSDGDVYREVAYQTIQVIDWRQTLTIAKHPNSFSELNPLLDKHPTEFAVNRYFVISSITHAIIANYLPSKWRPTFQYITIGVEVTAVANNFKLGIAVDF